MRHLITYGFVLLSFVCFTQKIESNVDQKVVQKGKYNPGDIDSWDTKDLDVTTFRNGDTLFHAQTDEQWNKAGEDEIPAYCFYENSNDILYNYYAVSSKNNLAPWGYRIPDTTDFINLNTSNYELRSKNGSWKDSEIQKNDFNALATGYRDWGEFEHQFALKGYQKLYWTTTTVPSDIARVYAFSIKYGKPSYNFIFAQNGIFEDYNAYKNEGVRKNLGLSVRVLKKAEEQTFKYSELRSDAWNLTVDLIRERISQDFFEVNSTNRYNATLIFSETGILNIQSNLDSPNSSSLSLKNSIDNIFRQNLEAPVYLNEFLKSEDALDINFTCGVEEHKINWKKLDKKMEKDKDLPFPTNELRLIEQTGFAFSTRFKKIEFEEYPDIDYVYIKSVSARGPGFASLSLIPGLGSKMVSRGKEKMKYLLAASCPILLIGTFSKLYSNFAYTNYLREPYGNNALYERANFTHKTFIVTTLLYGGLMSIDLVWTIKTGIKNKTNQKKVNNYLQEQTPLGLRIR